MLQLLVEHRKQTERQKFLESLPKDQETQTNSSTADIMCQVLPETENKSVIVRPKVSHVGMFTFDFQDTWGIWMIGIQGDIVRL